MATLHLIGRRAIDQGSRYELTIRADGNLAAAAFRGSIRSGINGIAELAAFSFSTPTYNPTTNKTTLLAFMTGTVTGAIAATAPDLRYDIKAQLPGADPIRLLQGRAAINPEVKNA